jgi:subtilisin family serine protease
MEPGRSVAVSDDRDLVESWVLVRLSRPLERRISPGSFELATGLPELDALIQEAGVHRIDYALATTMREPKQPAALSRYGLDRVYKFHVPPGTDVWDLVEELARIPGVEHAEPDFIVRPGAVIPNDPLFPDQWYLHQPSDADIDAPEAWEITVGEDVLVAVVDTGGDSDHPDLVGKWEWGLGYDFIDDDPHPEDEPGGTKSGHGTCAASIIGAETNNSEGVAGVCWDCRLVPVRVFDQNGSGGTASVIADGLVWAADTGAQVINFSGGATGHNDILLGGANYAADLGVTLVTITHNDGLPAIRYPGEYLETITIGGTDSDDQWWPNSNYGPRIDVVAPATSIWGAYVDGDYLPWTGTSFAAPQVTGLVGLLMSLDPSLGREEARHLMRAGAEDEVGLPLEDPPGFDDKHGWGRINLHRSLLAAESSLSLRVEGGQATRVNLDTVNPRATSYDFIRGDLDALTESWRGVDLGTVVCLEDDSPDADTTGNEDLEVPDLGEAFFYLARFNAAPGAGSYGGSTQNRDRIVIPPSNAMWMAEGEQEGARFGISVSSAGDVNGDGHDDVIIGAPYHDDDQADEGRVYLYLGSTQGLEATPAWTLDGNQAGAQFGRTVAGAGDVDNDGHDDVIVGARYFDNGHVDEGCAFVYHGTSSGLETTPRWTADGNQADARLGYYVASAGDVNGDGYDDVIVGAPFYDNGNTNEGQASVYLGSSSGLAASPVWTAEGNQNHAWFGLSAATAGNINGDRFDDVVVSAPGYNSPETDEGRIYLFQGTSTGPETVASAIREIDVESAQLGTWSVGTAGDVNCDGYDDVIASAVIYANGEPNEGAAFVWLGSRSGLETTHVWSFESDVRRGRLGSASTAGHLNDADCDAIIVGADVYDSTRTDDGRAWVFFGSSTGPSATPDWTAAGDAPVAKFGSVATAGDVNGDGYDDLIVGAWAHDGDGSDLGRVYVYSGSPTGPPALGLNGDCSR